MKVTRTTIRNATIENPVVKAAISAGTGIPPADVNMAAKTIGDTVSVFHDFRKPFAQTAKKAGISGLISAATCFVSAHTGLTPADVKLNYETLKNGIKSIPRLLR